MLTIGKKLCSKVLTVVCAALMLFSTTVTYALADSSGMDASAASAVPNCLKCGDMTSTKGFALKKITEPATDDYYISYNYMYPSGQTMSGFCVWGSYDGKEYDDTSIIQNGNRLAAKAGAGAGSPLDLDVTLSPDVWYSIVIHCKPDNTFEIFINGAKVKIGSNYSATQIGTGKMTAIGYIGDLSTAAHDGCGYFDNIRVVAGGTVIANEDFNSGSLAGWTPYSTCALANPPLDCPAETLDSIALTAERTGLVTGQSVQLALSGTLSSGNALILGTADSIGFTSSDSSVLSVNQEGGTASVTAVGAGTATVTASVTLNGITRTSQLEFLVTSTPVMYTVRLDADKTRLLKNDTAIISLYGLYTDGSSESMDINGDVTFESSNDGIISLSLENGILTAEAVGTGKAVVTAETVINGITRTAPLEFNVLYLDSVELIPDKTSIFAGDSTGVSIKGTLNDGSAADMNLVDAVTMQSSDSNTVEVVYANGTPELEGVAPGEADITANVTMRGTTCTSTVRMKVVEVTSSKTRSTYYTTAEINAARANVRQYGWAESAKDAAVAKAETYLQLGYDFLWNLITPQSIPRSYAVNQPLGCLNCGKEIDKFGNYPYKADPVNDPWKLECPNCHMKFPTNDFEAYYESGKDDHGVFNPELADKSLLVNTLYPEKGEKWGVDDGFGYKDENGKIYTFIAYYDHWSLWYSGIIQTALDSFRDAYIYTGDAKYARAGIIMLDRIADVYPSMDIWPYKIADGFLNSNGNSNTGKVVGSIWETGLADDFLTAYDAFFPAIDDAEVISFLSAKSDEYQLGVLKKSATGIKRNIEDGIVRQIFPAVKSAAIRGNNGMHQKTLATAAVVLDTLPETKEWLDFNFKAGSAGATQVTGGNILATFVNDIDRDGNGTESAPGYNRLWLSQFLNVADTLQGYDLYPAADLYNNVKFKKMFSSMYPLMLTDLYSALIGDSGSTGNPINYLDKMQCVKAFEHFGDPIFAQLAYFLNGNQIEGIHGDIFSTDPESVASDIQNVIEQYGELHLGSTNLTGYGFTALRDGEITRDRYGIIYKFPNLQALGNSKNYATFTNGAVQLEGTAPGDYITFSFDVPAANEYEVDLKLLRASSYGIYDIKIDGQTIDNIDFFGSITEYAVLGTKQLDAGTHTITFECTGRNGASSGCKLGVFDLALLDSAAQAQKLASIDTQRALWLYYGRNTGHGHPDTLNIGYNAFKLDLMPELGYPEYADETAHRTEWVSNTISHNTVVVDKAKQGSQVVGQPRHFDDSGFVKLIDVEAPKVYTQTSIYRRTTAMIRVDGENSYAVDFFRVKGGTDHSFSFHSAEGTVTTEGLTLVPQTDAGGNYIGTYAGADVEFGVRPANDSVAGSGYKGPGFHWLKNVDRDTNPSQQFSVDWKIKDTWNTLGNGVGAESNVHLRLTMLGQMDDVALADGVPPRNKPGNPASLRYLVAHRSGQNLDSLFTSVIEPYKAERYIDSITTVSMKVNGQPVESSDAKAVKVVFKDGRVDYIIYALDNNITYTVDDKLQFKGFLGVYSERDGLPVKSYINDGETLGGLLVNITPRLSGTVLDFTKELSSSNSITVQMGSQDFNAEDLVGRYIYIQNDGVRNASYKIEGIVSRNGNIVTLDTGDVTPIRSWKDSNDFSKGYIYDFADGAAFTIPLSDYYAEPLSQVVLTADNQSLTRGQTANLSVRGVLASGAQADIKDAEIEFISSDPSVAAVDGNGTVTAYNAGSCGIYAKVTLDGVEVQSEAVPFIVTTDLGTIGNLLEMFIDSGDVSGPLVNQLINSLKQAKHQMEMDSGDKAAKHMEDFLKHLNNPSMQDNVSDNAKSVLNSDVNALILLLRN